MGEKWSEGLEGGLRGESWLEGLVKYWLDWVVLC